MYILNNVSNYCNFCYWCWIISYNWFINYVFDNDVYEDGDVKGRDYNDVEVEWIGFIWIVIELL